MPFTEDELRRARHADLVAYLKSHGFRLVPEGRGNYSVSGYGGLVVKDFKWNWFSQDEKGNAVDFLMKVLGMPFQEAVTQLLGQVPTDFHVDVVPATCLVKPSFCMPKLSPNIKRVWKYLTEKRAIPAQLVGRLSASGLLFEDMYGNCVFPCIDKNSGIRGAALRSTREDEPIPKRNAPGSDGNFGWHWLQNKHTQATLVTVTESAIDAISLTVLASPVLFGHVLSLNGSKAMFNTLQTFLSEHSEVDSVLLALDDDQIGRESTHEFGIVLRTRGYVVGHIEPEEGFKDWNEKLHQRQLTNTAARPFVLEEPDIIGV